MRAAQIPPKRFFLYLQTIDPHVPYNPPAEYTKMYHPDAYRGRSASRSTASSSSPLASRKPPMQPAPMRSWIRALYDAEVSYHDAHMGKFLDRRPVGLLDETLFIVTNDHGEEIEDHGKLGHGHSLYDELVRAPCSSATPRCFRGGRRATDPVENVDLFPTDAGGPGPRGGVGRRRGVAAAPARGQAAPPCPATP